MDIEKTNKVLCFHDDTDCIDIGVECPPAQYYKAKCVSVANLQKRAIQIPYKTDYANMIVELSFVAFETLQPKSHTRNTP